MSDASDGIFWKFNTEIHYLTHSTFYQLIKYMRALDPSRGTIAAMFLSEMIYPKVSYNWACPVIMKRK